MTKLYRKICSAEFSCPASFSPQLSSLLRAILNPNPKARLHITNILRDNWFTKKQPEEYESVLNDCLKYEKAQKTEKRGTMRNIGFLGLTDLLFGKIFTSMIKENNNWGNEALSVNTSINKLDLAIVGLDLQVD